MWSDRVVGMDLRCRGHPAYHCPQIHAFQRAVAERGIAVRPNPMLRVSLGATAIRRDGSGNPALDKSHWDARIDVAAAVIACGLRAVAAKENTGTLFRISV